ncbi:hypothetical protein Tco_0135281 [Tanacetum coccineum]
MLRFSMPQDQAGNLGIMKYEQRMRCFRHDWYGLRTYTTQETTDPDWKGCKRLRKVSNSNVVDEILAASNLLDKSLIGKILKAVTIHLIFPNPSFDHTWKTPFEFFINNDLKYLQGGILTMTYTTSTTKTKAAKYDLPGIEDMVPNIWSLVKVAYESYCIMGYFSLDWEQFHSCLGNEKLGYGYSRRDCNTREELNKNWLTNLSGDDVADFAITLRMFTRSLVIQKRVEDLQLRVKSYQKQINVTKPDTTRPDIRKRHSYTPYKDPQGFIYVDDIGRNRLMRTDELYKFSDDTLTRLLSSLEDITKNIDMTYLPKRRWSNLEKKRVHFMIKDINKLLKERRMMRSLEKFVGGRLYGTDLRLLQRISSYLKGYELTILADKFLEMMTLASEDFNLLASLISWCLLETFLNENMLSRSSRIRRNILKMVMEIKQWHGYAVSSLMDTAYWSSE